MEASALQAPAGLTRARISVSAPLLRLRSDDQLVALFRAGHDDAFRVIHDRYRQRLFAYTRQMLPGASPDAEDVLQDVFVRAYSGLRANRRELALRPWLYRVAHNRCIDELRRPVPSPTAIGHELGAPAHDPIAQVEQRESLRRLIADLLRLPAQQRSALLMRELGGMSYAEVAAAMDVTIPAVKSLLVRARIGLTLAAEARDTACVAIRDEIALAQDRGVRCSGTVRRHVTDCGGCRDFQSQLRRSRHQFASLTPTLGPIGVLANLLGWGGGAAGGGVAATSGATATTSALVGGGAAGTLGAGASHIAALIAATVVTAGGAVAIQHDIAPASHAHSSPPPRAATVSSSPAAASSTNPTTAYRAPSTATPSPSSPGTTTKAATNTASGAAPTSTAQVISGGDNIVPTAPPPGGADPSAPGATGETGTGTSGATGTSSGTTGTSGTMGTTGTSTGTTGATTSTAAGGTSPGTISSSSGATGSASPTPPGSPSSTSGSTTSGAGATPPTTTGTTGQPAGQ